jgi:hypothetical protein
LVGTYSSIAIAAPILLVGSDKGDGGPREGGGSKEESRKLPTTPVGQLQRA